MNMTFERLDNEDYDYTDPTTWPESPEKYEALDLLAWKGLDPEDHTTWPEGPELQEALAICKDIDDYEAWLASMPWEEANRRIDNADNDPEMAQWDERLEWGEKRWPQLVKELRARRPKNVGRRLGQLIDAEEEAYQREFDAREEMELEETA